MKGKRGQLSRVQGIIIPLIIIGILLGVGFLVLEKFVGQDILSDTDFTVANETVTQTELSENSKLDGSERCQANTFEIDVVYNSSDIKIGAGNYTLDEDTGRFKNDTTEFTGDSWKVSYTYQAGEGACSAVDETIDATSEIPGWLTITVILVIVGLLLVIVFTVLPSETDGFTSGVRGIFGGGGGTTAEI